MSNAPQYQAFICVQAKEKGGKPRWVRVGSVFAHKNGEGFDVVLPEGVAVYGRVVCLPPLPSEKAEAGEG